MIKVRIEMPDSAGFSGTQDVDLPAVPRVGEVVKDANNRYYLIEAVVYQPFEQDAYPKILVEVANTYATSARAAISGAEIFNK